MKQSKLIFSAFASIMICNLNAMQTDKKPLQKIVFFRGMSTLGKGELCREIVRQGSGWQLVNDDDCTMEVELAMCQKQFPEEYATIAQSIAPENLFHAIKRIEVFYKPETSVEQKRAVRAAIARIRFINNKPGIYQKEERHREIKNLIKDRIHAALKNNYHVVNDSWVLTQADFAEFAQYDIIRTYYYIPLDLLITSLINTNRETLKTHNLKNRRSFWHILNSFDRLLSKGGGEQKPLDSISRENFLEALARIEKNLPKTAPEFRQFTHQEMTTQELDERRKKYLANIGTNKGMHLYPDLSYDIIIKKTSPSDDPGIQAQKLLKHVEAKAHS